MKYPRAIGLTGVLGIAAAMAVLALASPDLASGSAPVAWVDRPAAVPAAGMAAAPAAPAVGTLSCTSADLSVRPTGHGVLSYGTGAYTYTATNTSGRPCYVSGFPSVELAGKAVPHAANALGVQAGTLAPGASAIFAVLQTASASCQADPSKISGRSATEVPKVAVGANQGPASAGSVTVNGCVAMSVTPIGVTPSAPAPDEFSRLAVSLSAPSSVAAGQALQFTVTLTNPTGKAIRLSPCPSYETGISSASPAEYQLNCTRPDIPAHQSVSYAMRYQVPAAAPAGLAKIGWFLLNSTYTGTGGVITITR